MKIMKLFIHLLCNYEKCVIFHDHPKNNHQQSRIEMTCSIWYAIIIIKVVLENINSTFPVTSIYLDKATQSDSIFPFRTTNIFMKNRRIRWNTKVNKWTICSSNCYLISYKMYNLGIFAKFTG